MWLIRLRKIRLINQHNRIVTLGKKKQRNKKETKHTHTHNKLHGIKWCKRNNNQHPALSERSNHSQRNIGNRKEFAIPVKSPKPGVAKCHCSHITKGKWHGKSHRCRKIINTSFWVSSCCAHWYFSPNKQTSIPWYTQTSVSTSDTLKIFHSSK